LFIVNSKFLFSDLSNVAKNVFRKKGKKLNNRKQSGKKGKCTFSFIYMVYLLSRFKQYMKKQE